MIGPMPGYGGYFDEPFEPEPVEKETLASNADDNWGKKIFQEMDDVMGGAIEADFCNEKGDILFSIKKILGGTSYAVINNVESVKYSFSYKGHVSIMMVSPKNMEIVHEKIALVERNIATMKTLIRKEKSS
jgi:hypothetical protein